MQKESWVVSPQILGSSVLASEQPRPQDNSWNIPKKVHMLDQASVLTPYIVTT